MPKSMLRKIFGNCICNNCETDDDQLQEQQFSNRKTTRLQHSNTETTLISVLESNNGLGPSKSYIKRSTPVLFSTNRGLYLRVAKIAPPNSTESINDNGDHSALYDISFCDLERWSTNRAHTINLEDTFTIERRTLEPVQEHPSPTSEVNFPNCSTCSSRCSGSNNFMPIKRTMRFNNIYSRFDSGQYPHWRY